MLEALDPCVEGAQQQLGERREDPNHAWVGGPKDIADRIEEWWESRGCDGFVIGPTHQPGCFEEFVKHVIPELQKRGIYRKEYTGATLRDHLGLKRPAIGDWRGNTDAAD